MTPTELAAAVDGRRTADPIGGGRLGLLDGRVLGGEGIDGHQVGNAEFDKVAMASDRRRRAVQASRTASRWSRRTRFDGEARQLFGPAGGTTPGRQPPPVERRSPPPPWQSGGAWSRQIVHRSRLRRPRPGLLEELVSATLIAAATGRARNVPTIPNAVDPTTTANRATSG